MPLPSAAQIIHSRLKACKHDKWGWVLYRCTHGDDAAGARFKELVQKHLRESIAEPDVPDPADSLEWTFVEDRESLDCASKDNLRTRFRQWAAEAIRAEQPRTEHHRTFGVPRYNYFIQVDKEALESVLTAHGFGIFGGSHFSFIDANWKLYGETFSEEDPDEDPEEVFEKIERCENENFGWMKIARALHVIGTEFNEAATPFGDSWYAFYQWPPETVVW